MLTITQNAEAAVKALTTEPGMPEAAGLRLALAPDQSQLELVLVPEPQPGDQTVLGSDARVYVAEEVAPALDGQLLDAVSTADGVGFSLQPQQSEQRVQQDQTQQPEQ